MKYFWRYIWSIFLVALGVWEFTAHDWAFGVMDFSVAILLAVLSVDQGRRRERERVEAAAWEALFRKLTDGEEVAMKKDPTGGGYIPVETPEHTPPLTLKPKCTGGPCCDPGEDQSV